MTKIVVPFLIAAFLGLGWYFFSPDPPDRGTLSDAAAGATNNASSLSYDDRLAALERAIADERQARQVLQEELLYLTGELERLQGDDPDPGARAATPVTAASTGESDRGRRWQGGGRDSPDLRAQRLIDAGLSAERAEWVLQREAALRMAAMEARYEAQRSGERVDYGALRQREVEAFRNELGAADYERYLEGTGRSTAVVVGSVIDTSPAQSAGLQPGDRIVRYGGERVYNMGDLNRAMLSGQAGESVTAEVVRDGVSMQVALRRGPLGITSRRGGRR